MTKTKIASITLLLIATISLINCKTTKSVKEEKPTAVATAATTEINPNLMAAAEKRFPGIKAADITEGQRLYYGRCGNCHSIPEITSESEQKWPKIMDWMAPKSNMDEAQKQKTLQYVLSALDMSKK
jgi:cytochrome c5